MKFLFLLFCLFSFSAMAAVTEKQQNFCDTGLVHVLLTDNPPQEFYVDLNKTRYKYIWFYETNTELKIYWENIIDLNQIELFLRKQPFISAIQCLDNKDFKQRR
jgi:hypothetical protein